MLPRTITRNYESFHADLFAAFSIARINQYKLVRIHVRLPKHTLKLTNAWRTIAS
jgi:hypothetical protein